MFTRHDIPIAALGLLIIFASAWLVEAREVRYAIGLAVTVAAVTAHVIWEEIRTEGSFHLRSPRKRRKVARQS
jgi:hypothetical protein